MDWLFEHDTALKILAVLVAIAVWAQVNYTASAENYFTTSVSFYPPRSASLHVMTPQPDKVTVYIKGPPSAVTSNGVSASVNLSNVSKPGTATYLVSATVPPGTQLVKVIPRTVTVTVVQYVSRSFPVKVHAAGTLAPGYGMVAMALRDAHAVVSGPSNLVRRVHLVVAAVMLSGQSTSFSEQVGLKAVDAAGAPVKGVVVSPATRTVNVTVSPEKALSVTVRYSGNPAAGFSVGAIEVSPLHVTVFGPASVLAALTTIYTTPVNIGGASGPVSARPTLDLPPGVTAVAPSSVSVVINIQ